MQGVNGNPEAGLATNQMGETQIPWYCKLSAKELRISGGKITGTTFTSARKSCQRDRKYRVFS